MTDDAKARGEDELARVQDALEVTEEARRKVEGEVSCLEVERTSFMLEVGATKDEVSSLQSQVSKDKAAMEENYQKALELIFAYGYKCCMFKHNIYGDQPEVVDGMPDSSESLPPVFSMNPRCPSAPIATKATAIEVDQREVAGRAEELERSAPARDFDGAS